MISDIPLTLRLVKGSEVTKAEMDANLVNLRSAILQTVSDFKVRVVVGAEPPLGERPNTVWIPDPSLNNTAFVWNTSTNAWVQFAQFVGRDVVFGAEPASGLRDKVVWIPSDYRAVYVWDGSAWVAVTAPAPYAVASAVANAYSATIPGTWTLSTLTGRQINLKIPSSNTAASTLNVNTLGAVPIVKRGGDALSADDLKTGMVASLVYDGASWNLLNPKVAISTKIKISDIAIPASGAKSDVLHNLGFTPDSVEFQLVCTVDDAATGYVAGWIFQGSTPWDSPGSGDEEHWLGCGWDGTKVRIYRNDLPNINVPHASTNVLTPITTANWRLQLIITS